MPYHQLHHQNESPANFHLFAPTNNSKTIQLPSPTGAIISNRWWIPDGNRPNQRASAERFWRSATVFLFTAYHAALLYSLSSSLAVYSCYINVMVLVGVSSTCCLCHTLPLASPDCTTTDSITRYLGLIEPRVRCWLGLILQSTSYEQSAAERVMCGLKKKLKGS